MVSNMKKISIFILFFAVVFSFASYKAIVNASSLNVRDKPSEKSEIIDKLEKNWVVSVDTCFDDFCKINYGSISGYASSKYLNQAPKNETSKNSDWWILVLFILGALGIAEIGFRTRIGCISAGSSVIAIILFYLLLDELDIGSVYCVVLVALAINVILVRNRRSTKKMKEGGDGTVDSDVPQKEAHHLGDIILDGIKVWSDVLKGLFAVLSFFDGSSSNADKKVLYCEWRSDEYGQSFYVFFAENVSFRNLEKVLERQYGRGRLCQSACSKTVPSWFATGDGKTVLYCEWYSSEYNQSFYEIFSANTYHRTMEKVLERQYGRGSLRQSTKSQTAPSWYGKGKGQTILYCEWHSSEYNHSFYEIFSANTNRRAIENVLERQYGRGSLRQSTQARTVPGWYKL